ncbi:hypothetical protein Z946_3207 [Sulfitobacter noctilucicola]|uniref:Lipoprotein n=1 Tax=Sulfitobacter noctilucicola TaxID=1342301 RepID=A0A7W6Q4S5_9RHOB|nr:hypothetical protein [Sulfitobacter noctilucicola]KIN64316.1 hypothetical protein Z946_3207 [Sulfitobacter noctilucicola]MBB4174519.1 hypothetical protein [Sulfitobacter noctilucicola]
MLRHSLIALCCAGLLSACTDIVVQPTPPQPMMDPNYSYSAGFTSIGYEPF